ncbi:MAG: twin-arginine translocase subunit TatC [Dehalococcoidia bacterium]|nr:twin-arginine translocase subunit TatC [Dehalococcoidia bacterium]
MSAVVEELPQAGVDEEGKKLTVLEHLDELRQRLIISAIGVAVTTAISFIFTKQLLLFLKEPAGTVEFITIEATEGFSTYFKVALYSGLGLGLPMLLFQAIMFLAPGLTRNERRYLRFLLPGSVVCFILGVLFAYYIALPPALRFLIPFLQDIATPQIRIGDYVTFVTTLLFWTGVVFETPIVIFFLAKLKIVNYKMLAKNRKFALLGAFVIAAIITPSPDPITQIVVAMPLLALYEAGIWLARIA